MLYILPHQCCRRPCDKCQDSPAFPYADDASLDQKDRFVIPRIQIAPEQVLWLCLDCWLRLVSEDREPEEVLFPYEHPRIRPGLNGMVSEQIKEVIPDCLLAGKLVRTCTGLYSLRSDFFAEELRVDDGHSMNYRLNHHLFQVPVHGKDEDPSQVGLMPEDYVLID